MDAARFVTLTLADDGQSLGDRIAKLRAAWKSLRRSKLWRERVTGGMYGVEITRGREGTHWHVHIHAIIDGQYIDQKALSAQWNEATKGSPIVDIRAAHSRSKAARYLAKYVTKPAEIASWTDEQIREWARAVHGQRLIQTFGHLHGATIDPRDNQDELPETTRRYPADWIRKRILGNDANAPWLVNALTEIAPAIGDAFSGLIEPSVLRAHRIDADPADVVESILDVWCGPGGTTTVGSGADPPIPPPRGRIRAAHTARLWTEHAATALLS